MLHKMKWLMAPVNDRGGGGGTNKKKPDDDDDDDENNTPPVDEKKLGEMVNGAVRNFMKRGAFQEMLATAVTGALEPALGEIKETLGKLGKSNNTDDDDAANKDKKNGNGGGGGIPKEVQEQIDELKRSNKKLTDDVAKEKQEKQAATRRNEQQEERSKLREELKKQGVPDERLNGVVALLYADQNRVVRDKEGKIKYVVVRDGYDEQVELEEGVKEWAKSDEGKNYLAPVGVQGGGTRGGPPPIRRGEEPSETQLMGLLGNAMLGHKVELP